MDNKINTHSDDSKKELKVSAEYLSKQFELQASKNSSKKKFWALHNINFEMFEGESIAIIGLNGSGKSTLLNIIDKSMKQTVGNLEINGRVSYVAIGAGLKGNLTGRENIYIKSYLMGLTKKEVKAIEQDIIEFAELEDFIDQPIKDYSSGMRTKLAFSIAVYQDPDILIIDEALSVGDSTFAEKSAKKMFEFREQKKTIFIVSHNAGQVKKWADKVLWLHYGEVKEYGSTKQIFPKYQQFVKWFNTLTPQKQEEYKNDRLKEQFEFSLDSLKEEITDNSSMNYHEVSNMVNNSLKRNKAGKKMSFGTKILIFICVLLMSLTALASVRNMSFKTVLTSPSKLFSPLRRNSDIHTKKYTVKKDENYISIAEKFSLDMTIFKNINYKYDLIKLKEGDVILIPKNAKEIVPKKPNTTKPSSSKSVSTTSEEVEENPVEEQVTAEQVPSVEEQQPVTPQYEESQVPSYEQPQQVPVPSYEQPQQIPQPTNDQQVQVPINPQGDNNGQQPQPQQPQNPDSTNQQPVVPTTGGGN